MSPRFYLDTLIGADLHLDHEGAEYTDLEQAVRAAKLAAAEYVADKIVHAECPDHEEKLVRNDAGDTVARFMVIDALATDLPRVQ